MNRHVGEILRSAQNDIKKTYHYLFYGRYGIFKGIYKVLPFFLRIMCGHVAAHVNKVNGVENF